MSKYAIKEVIARQIYDSRANPTVEVDITLEGGARGRGMVPSGASTGAFEALELRDKDPAVLGGKSVRKAISNIQTSIANALIGLDATCQAEIDATMIWLDGTENKSRLGANAILGCSVAVANAAADAYGVPLYRYLGGAQARTLPVPMVQIIGGGAHAYGATDIQDYLVIPMGGESFEAAYEMVVNVYNAAKAVFAKYGKPLSVADEGGLWPTGFASNEEGLALLTEAISRAGYEPGKDVSIALDIASSEFYDKDKGLYRLALEDAEYDSGGFTDLLVSWADKYPVISIEDGCSEFDWDGNALLTRKLGRRAQIIGDDLFTTNIGRIKKGVANRICNAVLIKMNQIGTITETLEAIEYTKTAGYLPVISARSGETEDATIVHLAVATNAGQLKVGSVARSERTAKWNEAIRIEQRLGAEGVYPSGGLFDRILSSRAMPGSA